MNYSCYNKQFAEGVLSESRLDTNTERINTLKNKEKEICQGKPRNENADVKRHNAEIFEDSWNLRLLGLKWIR